MAAAIIGPGTVTTASTQGANYGYTALWIILLACIIAYFFQEPGARIAIGCNQDAMTGIREHVGKGMAKFLYVVILVGSIAFQAGNLSGASMALVYFMPGTTYVMWAITMSIAAIIIVWFNKYKIIENVNQLLIVMMVLAFVITAFSSGPSIGTLFTEGFSMKIPGGNATLALGLLATTVTPNLILGYSSFLRKKHPKVDNATKLLTTIRFDLGLNMFITFMITGSIVICAAATIHPLNIKIKSAADMAMQLTPLLGRFAGVFFSLGLWAAAFSSVLYQISLHNMLLPKAFNLSDDPKAKHNVFITCLVVLVPIAIVILAGSSPVSLIITAQALNGIALPIVFIVSWILCNKKDFLGKYANTLRQNIIFGIVTFCTLAFAINALIGVANRIIGLLKA
jgi:manganese transport protein